MGEKIDDGIPNVGNFLTQLSFELLGRRAQGEVGARANQIDHGFGLGQVHFAVKKCTLGKFARPGAARARV